MIRMRDLMKVINEAVVDESRFGVQAPAKPVEAPISARAQGWEAARTGAEVSANPHSSKGSKEAHDWDVGYQNYFMDN